MFVENYKSSKTNNILVGVHRPSDCNLINGFYFVCIQNITRLAGHAQKRKYGKQKKSATSEFLSLVILPISREQYVLKCKEMKK